MHMVNVGEGDSARTHRNQMTLVVVVWSGCGRHENLLADWRIGLTTGRVLVTLDRRIHYQIRIVNKF